MGTAIRKNNYGFFITITIKLYSTNQMSFKFLYIVFIKVRSNDI